MTVGWGKGFRKCHTPAVHPPVHACALDGSTTPASIDGGARRDSVTILLSHGGRFSRRRWNCPEASLAAGHNAGCFRGVVAIRSHRLGDRRVRFRFSFTVSSGVSVRSWHQAVASGRGVRLRPCDSAQGPSPFRRTSGTELCALPSGGAFSMSMSFWRSLCHRLPCHSGAGTSRALEQRS